MKTFFLLIGIVLFGQNLSAQSGKNKVDPMDKFMLTLSTDLKLDSFQQAAIRNIFDEQMKNMTSVHQNQDMSVNEKQDRAVAIVAKSDAAILQLLNAEQTAKYLIMKEKSEKKSGRRSKVKQGPEQDLYNTPADSLNTNPNLQKY